MPTTITRLFGTARDLIERGAQSAPASQKKAKGFVRKAVLNDAANRAQQLLGTL